MGNIDPTSGQYIYDGSDSFAGVPVQDVLNRAQNAAKNAATADRIRLDALESQVGSAFGVALFDENVTLAAGETTVPFDKSGPMSGVTRAGAVLTVQSSGVYLVMARMAGTLSGTAERDIWVTKNGTTIILDASTARAAAGTFATSQYAVESFTVASLAAGDALRVRTFGGAGATETVAWQRMSMFGVLKVSG